MAIANFEDLTIPTLNALASSPNGTMTLGDLMSHLETRYGSTEEGADDAQSPQSRTFADQVRAMLSDGGGAASLVSRGFVTIDNTGALVQITPEGRRFIGR